jgi:hypothetical protein
LPVAALQAFRQDRVINPLKKGKTMLILIAGPYRSGTNDDPARMAENLKRLEEPSYALFEAGHIPIIGEWVVLPVGMPPVAAISATNSTRTFFTPLPDACFRSARVCCACPAPPREQITM